MTGHVLLEGGAEFGGAMREPDLRAIELAGGSAAPVRIIPTAAAPDNNHERAGGNGQRWFHHLGATDVAVLPLIDAASANDPEIAGALRGSRLVYLLGGFTHYLGQTLKGSAAWEAILEAYESGAVIAGSSAGAMVLCQWYYHPQAMQVVEGLGLVTGAIVLPHHDTFGHRWAPHLSDMMPEAVLLGIDEGTGIIDDGDDGMWQVYGQGVVTLYHGQCTSRHSPGDPFCPR